MSGPLTRPFVTLKIAQTIDGRVATTAGSSRWVTGFASREAGHALRAGHDAILVGVGTIVADNPELTVRLAKGLNPVRVILDSSVRLPPIATVLKTDVAPTIVITTPRASLDRIHAVEAAGARVVQVPDALEGVDVGAALDELGVLGIRSVLVEGGAQVATTFLHRRLVDRIIIFIAPKIIGAGIEAIGDLGAVTMDDAITFDQSTTEIIEDGIVFEGRPRWPALDRQES